jgi:hypothetical protein
MRIKHRHFIVTKQHKRFQRAWQFFFTGWGLVMVASLVAAPFLTRDLIWTPIASIDFTDIASNQFKMENASFAGVDKNGEPFELRVARARQEYRDENLIHLETVRGKVIRVSDGQRITDVISARNGVYDKSAQQVRLIGDVAVDSSNGDKIRTKELEIQL